MKQFQISAIILTFSSFIQCNKIPNITLKNEINLKNQWIIQNNWGLKWNFTHDIDVDLRTPALIEKYGYPCEPHLVTTADGFILTLYRIPHGKNNNNSTKSRQPIIIQHGLVTDSSCFFLYKEKSLPFLLSESGYDIWLSNLRGTVYSSDHIKYESSDPQFWDWSWDEMAAYDLSKIIKHVAVKTNQTGNILYVGHSMGTTVFFALMSAQPHYNQYIKAMFALSPVAYTKHIKGPLHYFSHVSNVIFWIYQALGIGQVIPHVNIFRKLLNHGCSYRITSRICQDLLFLLAGFDKDQLTPSKFSLFTGHFPQPTSIRTVIHYGQGDFEYFDFGRKMNYVKYGQETPLKYNLTKISVPIAIYVGQNDWLSQKMDVDRFWKQIENKITRYVVPFKDFNHLDFIWSKDVMKLLYNNLISDIKKYS